MDRIKHLRKKKFNPLQLDKIIYLPIGILVITIAAAVFLLTMPSYVECIGKLIPKEYYPIYSKANGLVISNNVIDGMRVKKGDFLFCLDNKTLFLNIQQLSLQTNDLHIQLKYLTQELKLLEKDKQVSVSILKKQYDNNRMLFKNDSISKEILDQSYLKYKNEDSGYQKQYNEITKSIDLQNNQLNQLEVVIEEKNILLSNTYYYTPIDGYIIYLAHFENTYQRDNDNFLKVKLQEGSFINDGTLVFYLVPDASLNAEIMIPEDKIYDVDISNDVILYFSSIITVGSSVMLYFCFIKFIEGESISAAIEISRILFCPFAFKSINMLDIACC